MKIRYNWSNQCTARMVGDKIIFTSKFAVDILEVRAKDVVAINDGEWMVIQTEMCSEDGFTLTVENINEIKVLPKVGDEIIKLGTAESWNKIKSLT